MTNQRVAGLAFLLIGVLTLLGNTMDVLPAEAFWVGLIAYPIGGYLLFASSSKAIQKVEHRTSRSLDPTIQNERSRAYAEQQARNLSKAPDSIKERVQHARAQRAQASHREQVLKDELVLYEVDAAEATTSEGDFTVSTDVSFPLELQEQTSLAEQLDKLHRLQEEGIITAEEFAAAKTKLLS
jgi:hypothetical protein